jgi:hypothetical protein
MNTAPSTFIRVVEVWVPDRDHLLLEFGGGVYGAARRFGAQSAAMCFGRGEGLPGRAWEEGRPIVLPRLDEASGFRRTALAQADGLTSGIAMPVFSGDALKAVLLIFCGDDEHSAGAIELWHNDPAVSREMTLADGCYGRTGEAFEFISRRTSFGKGTGLPGLAWQSQMPVFMPDLGKGGRFLRADSAQQVGIKRLDIHAIAKQWIDAPLHERAVGHLLAEFRTEHQHRRPLAALHQVLRLGQGLDALDAQPSRLGQVALDDFRPLGGIVGSGILLAKPLVQVDNRNPQPVVGFLAEGIA